MGDVKSCKAHPLGCFYQLSQCAGAKAEFFEIDQFVDVTQALRGALLLVHRGGARGLNTGADEADEESALNGQCASASDQPSEALDCQGIALRAEPADHARSNPRDEGMMTEFFPLVDIGDMHLKDRKFAGVQSVE